MRKARNSTIGPAAVRRRGISTPLIVGMILAIAALAVGFAFVQGRDQGSGGEDHSELFAVSRGSFEITIPASGELVAMNQVEVRNRLEARAVIMEIVDEGEYVQQGDLLLRLNDDEVVNRILDAEDAVKTAESQLIAAEANLAIRMSAKESEEDKAELQVELAELALQAWEQGEVATRRKQLETALKTADINYERLKDRYENSITLHEREFISADELQQDHIAYIEAQARLEQAQLDLNVYNEYTYKQQLKQMNSDLEQARAELTRVKQRHAAELETARADLASKKYQLDSRRDRLADLRRQLDYCTVTAPTEGLVVYATSLDSGRRGNDDPPQVGTELSRNELVMLLPDTSRMAASVKVNEALSGLIRPGQRARITSDAMPDQTFTGEVRSVGVLAESGGWRDPNRRDYTVRIQLTGNNELNLRPSMRCRAEIYIDRVEDALYVPVQSVFRDGPIAYVFTPVRGGYAPTRITVGRSSELFVEVTDGLNAGDRVLLRRPQSSELVGSVDGLGGIERDSLSEGTPGVELGDDVADDADRRDEIQRGAEEQRPPGPGGGPRQRGNQSGRSGGSNGINHGGSADAASAAADQPADNDAQPLETAANDETPATVAVDGESNAATPADQSIETDIAPDSSPGPAANREDD